ncbi:MAG: type 4a pilus biogenesis protein PilO [Pseudomonadota bacterium]
MAALQIDFKKLQQEAQALDINNLGVWPLWARATTSAIVLVLVLVGGWFGVITGINEQIAGAQMEEQQLRAQFEEKQKKVAALDAYKEQLEQMKKSFGAMLAQLPSKTEVANLLNDISQTRVASSLEEELFQPQPEANREFYAEVPNKIIVTGNYHSMGLFVSGVAALPRIVTIDDVTIAPAGANAPKDQLRMTATAKTYRYLDDSELAGAKPGAKK